jgi:hypothetical protein
MILIAVIVMTVFHPGYCFGYKSLSQIPGASGDIELSIASTPKHSYLH